MGYEVAMKALHWISPDS